MLSHANVIVLSRGLILNIPLRGPSHILYLSMHSIVLFTIKTTKAQNYELLIKSV